MLLDTSILLSLLENTDVELIKAFTFSPSTDTVSKYNFRIAILSGFYLSFALNLNIISIILNNLYVCPFVVTKLITKVTV